VVAPGARTRASRMLSGWHRAAPSEFTKTSHSESAWNIGALPGDFEWDPLSLLKLKTSELSDVGRAMISKAGIVIQEFVSHGKLL
jgi:hypothetical protein